MNQEGQENTTAFVTRHKRQKVAALLNKALPAMQPAALKHQYLTTVANVLLHPEAALTSTTTGQRMLIGFGDFERTMPLVLIQDADTTVRHAFCPSLKNPHERQLVNKLAERERRWCSERGVAPRDIVGELQYYSRSEISRRGISGYSPPMGPFTKADIAQRGNWYSTNLPPTDIEIDHRGQIEVADELSADHAALSNNVADSVTMTLSETPGNREQVHSVNFDQRSARRGELRVTSLRIGELSDHPEHDEEPQFDL